MQPLADCTSLLALRRRGLQAHALASDVENYRRRRNQARALTEAEVRRRPVCCSAAALQLAAFAIRRGMLGRPLGLWAKSAALFGQALVGSYRGLLVPRFLSPLKEHSVSAAPSEPFSTICLRPLVHGCRRLTATASIDSSAIVHDRAAPSVYRHTPVSVFVQSRKVALSNVRLRSIRISIYKVALSTSRMCCCVAHIFLAGTRLCLNSA